MTNDDFDRLTKYYNIVKSVKEHIENLKHLIEVIKTRDAGQDVTINISVDVYNSSGTGHKDQCCFERIPVYVRREVLIPALCDSLRKLQVYYDAMQPVLDKRPGEE